ncbi:retrotransposon protein, putative, ty1-copia subclass, partial [Tanacetum coccineum]
IPIRRSERTHRAPNSLCLNVEVEEHSLGDFNELTSYKAAMLDLESNKWIDAMNAKIHSMMDNMVWVLVDVPPGCKTVGSRWIFKKKTDMDGIVHVYKARLIAKGYTKLYGVDYEETFSPVIDIRAIRILISIAAYYDYEIWQMDASGSNVTFLILYVDDIIIMGNHIPSLQSVKDYLGKCFAMKDLGEATFILGIKIYRDRLKRLIGLCQNAYIDKILKRYKMDNSKRGHIPMQERLDLNKSQGAQTPKEDEADSEFNYEETSSNGLILQSGRSSSSIKHWQRRVCDNVEMLSKDQLVNDMKITQLEIPTHQMNTKFVNNLQPIGPTALIQKDSQETELPQPTAQSPNDALMATMTQIANLLSGFQKQFPPTNNQLRTSSNSRTLATVHDGHIVTEPIQRKAPGNVGNTGARGKQVKCNIYPEEEDMF